MALYIDVAEKASKYLVSSFTGARGYGKTYSTAELVIKEFLARKKTAVLLRRYATELEDVESFFKNNINNSKDERVKSIKFKGGIFYLQDEPMMFTKALSSTKKGVIYPNCNKIIYDEYIPTDGIYLKNEWTKFSSFWETVGRLRVDVPLEDDIRVILLSNNDCKYNLYTYNFGVKYINNKYIYKDLKYFEVLKSSPEFINARKKSRMGQVLESSPDFAYMYENTNIHHRPEKVLKKVPQNIKPIANLNLSGYKIGAYFSGDDVIFSKKANDKKTITNNSEGFYRDPFISVCIDNFDDNVYFADLFSMEIFTDTLWEALEL